MQSGLIDLRSYLSKSSLEQIKAKFYLYDSLTTYTFEVFKEFQLKSPYGNKSYYEKIELLIDQGYIKAGNLDEINRPPASIDGLKNFIEIIELLEKESVRANDLDQKIKSAESDFASAQANFQLLALEERLFALMHKQKTNENIIPVTSLISYESLDLLFPKANVYRVLINNFPIPDDTVPLADIIQYRNEESNKLKLLRLHNWVKNIAEKNLRENEIAEEIELLMAEFKREIQLAGMKYKNSKLEFLTKFVPNLLEKMVKLSFSELFDPLFKLRNEKISLLEVENKAKGNELAYVINAQ